MLHIKDYHTLYRTYTFYLNFLFYSIFDAILFDAVLFSFYFVYAFICKYAVLSNFMHN